MHAAAYEYVQTTLAKYDVHEKRVLEFGSYEVNGSVRPLFEGAAEYVGLDIRHGPGVDIVTDARIYKSDTLFDFVVCCEMLEHCRYQDQIIGAAYRNLKKGGLLIITAAGVERLPHNGDGGRDMRGEFYANIDSGDLWEWLDAFQFARFNVTTNTRARDVYAWAIR